jgi:hypothetical protein
VSVEAFPIRWFGASWDAPICDPAFESEAPLGEKCVDCGKPVEEGQRGLIKTVSPQILGGLLFRWWSDGKERIVAAYHLACFERATLGAPRHLEASCMACNRSDGEEMCVLCMAITAAEEKAAA